MGFDILYMPPIHPIGTPSAKAPTTPSPPAPTTKAAPGRSAHPKVATKPSIPSLAPSPTSTIWSPPHMTTAWNWLSTSLSSARLTTPGSKSIPTGSSTVPTAPSSTPRIRPRSIRTSTRSISNPPTGRVSGTSSAPSSSSGSPAASASSGRQPPHQGPAVLGVVYREIHSSRRTRSSSPKPLPGRTLCTRLPRAASRSPTPTSPGARARTN